MAGDSDLVKCDILDNKLYVFREFSHANTVNVTHLLDNFCTEQGVTVTIGFCFAPIKVAVSVGDFFMFKSKFHDKILEMKLFFIVSSQRKLTNQCLFFIFCLK